MVSLSHIPTNVITGFLGSGKSTVILDLLKQKPDNENWAVLVNEFGEIGVDGSLIEHSTETSGIYIREVPGGCMCCTNGLPMQMAMSMLLARAKPKRLLIEPTGLGHPVEVLSVLSSPYYENVLDLCATVTLVDARKLSDERYTSHTTFNQQLEIADVIVASKADLYGEPEYRQLEQYLETNGGMDGKTLQVSRGGQLPLSLLTSKAQSLPDPRSMPEPTSTPTDIDTPPLPPEGYMRLSNSGDGFSSHGWLFDAGYVFDKQSIESLLQSTDAERIKAVVITEQGSFGYNIADNEMTALALETLDDSRVEIIASESFEPDPYEIRLLSTLSERSP